MGEGHQGKECDCRVMYFLAARLRAALSFAVFPAPLVVTSSMQLKKARSLTHSLIQQMRRRALRRQGSSLS